MLSSCLSQNSEVLTSECLMLAAVTQIYRVATAIHPMDMIMRSKMAKWSEEDWLDPNNLMFRNIRTGLASCKQRIRMNFGHLCESWSLERFAPILPLSKPTAKTVIVRRDLLTAPQLDWDSTRANIQCFNSGWTQTLRTSLTVGEYGRPGKPGDLPPFYSEVVLGPSGLRFAAPAFGTPSAWPCSANEVLGYTLTQFILVQGRSSSGEIRDWERQYGLDLSGSMPISVDSIQWMNSLMNVSMPSSMISWEDLISSQDTSSGLEDNDVST